MSHRFKNMRATEGRERNNSCPCGSGLKFKNCCGKPRNVVIPKPEPGQGNHIPSRYLDLVSMAASNFRGSEVKPHLSKLERIAITGWKR